MSTISTYTGDGSTTQFDITFDYADADTVKASVDGASAAFTFINASRVELDPAPAAGTEVRIYRETAVAIPVVDFEDGAIIRAPDLDAAVAQARNRAEELGSEVSALKLDFIRSVRVPFGEDNAILPSAAERAGKYISFLGDGSLFMASGTGADGALRDDLVTTSGALMVGTEDGTLKDSLDVRTVDSMTTQHGTIRSQQTVISDRTSLLAEGRTPVGYWDQRPQGTFRSPSFISLDHGGELLVYDPDLPQEWRIASSGDPVHAWRTPGCYLEMDFVNGNYALDTDDAAALTDIFATDPSARVVDEGGTYKGLKFGAGGSLNPLYIKQTVSEALRANSELTIEIDVVQKTINANRTIFDFVAASSPANNRISVRRIDSGHATSSFRRALQLYVTESSTLRLDLKGGSVYADSQIVDKVVTVRAVIKANGYSIQDLSSGERIDVATTQFPTMSFLWLGGTNAGSEILDGYIAAVRVWREARRAPWLAAGDTTTATVGKNNWQVQATPYERCITAEGNRVNRVMRFEVRPGDQWQADIDNGRTYAERAELAQQPNFAKGTTYWSAFSFSLDEFAREPGSNFTIINQLHGPTDATDQVPFLALRLNDPEADGQGLYFDIRSTSALGVSATVQTVSFPNFVVGKWHHVVMAFKVGDSGTGILKIWVDGVKIFEETSGQVGHNDATSGGYQKFGIYRTTTENATVVRFANVTGPTTTDLADLILNPAPIVV